MPPDEEAPPPPARKEPILRIPPVTGWLIALNVLIQVVRQFLPPGQDDVVVEALGFNTANLYRPITPLAVVSLVTYQFFHSGWDHVGINMVSLLAFGPGVERPLGPRRFLLIYFLSGIAGALLEAAFAARLGDDLLIGASASISGVFGALLVIWGIHRLGRQPMGILPMALLWIGLMTITGVLGVGAHGAPVAWIAHIGGFIMGMIFGAVFRPAPRAG